MTLTAILPDLGLLREQEISPLVVACFLDISEICEFSDLGANG